MAVQIVSYSDKVKMAIDFEDCGCTLTQIGEVFEVSRKTVRRCVDEVLDFYKNLKVGQKVYLSRDPDVTGEIVHKDNVIADITPLQIRYEDGDVEWHHLDEIMEANVGVDVEELQEELQANTVDADKDFQIGDKVLIKDNKLGYIFGDDTDFSKPVVVSDLPEDERFVSISGQSLMDIGGEFFVGKYFNFLKDSLVHYEPEEAVEEEVQKEPEENAQYFVVAPQDSITIMRVDQDTGEMVSHNINKNDGNFTAIRQMIVNDQSTETLREAYYLMNTKTALEAFSVGRVKVDPEGETVVFVKADGTERSVPEDLAGDIIETVKAYGQNESEKLVRFLDYLMDNPSFSAIEGLYRFMKHNCIEINEDGTIRAWKGVRNDLYDKHSGTIYNGNFGEEVRVDRSEVDDNSDNTCSYGLHVGNKEYATMWGDTLLCVTVNPKDVVAVPKDYNGAKMRTCGYTPNFVA